MPTMGHYFRWQMKTKLSDQEIEELTLEKVLHKINNFNRSGIFLGERNFSEYLAGTWFDESGKIAGAKATIIRLLNKLNSTDALLNLGKVACLDGGHSVTRFGEISPLRQYLKNGNF